MELNDANLQTLTEYLQKTLSPDPAVRRPGNIHISEYLKVYNEFTLDLTMKAYVCSLRAQR